MVCFLCGTRSMLSRPHEPPHASRRQHVTSKRVGKFAVPVALAGLALTFSSPSAAQSSPKPAVVDLGVKAGQTVSVLTTEGFFDGTVVSVDATALVIRMRTGPITLPIENIRQIDAAFNDSVANGALWGMAAGATLGGLAVVGNHGSCASSFSAGCGTVGAVLIAGSAAIGAAVGIVGDLSRRSRHTVFRGPSRLSVSVAPVLAPHTAGVQAQVRW